MKFLILLRSLSALGSPFGQAGKDITAEPKFSELSPQDSEQLNQQRAAIAAVAWQLSHASS